MYNLELGLVEIMSQRRVSGWAWDPAKSSSRLSVQVVCDGFVIYTAIADRYRQDLRDQGIGDGAHAFEILWANAQFGPESELSFRILELDVDLDIAPGAANWSTYEGVVELLTQQEISGWVWNQENPSDHLTVELVTPEGRIAVTIANGFREDLAAAGIGDGFHGFKFDISQHSGAPDSVEVRIPDTNFRIRRIYSSPSKVTGYLQDRPTNSSNNQELGQGMANYTEYFDEVFYRSRSGIDLLTGSNAIEHYKKTGWKGGRSPCVRFSSPFYLAKHQDVLLAGIEPLQHYLESGILEHREITQAPSDEEEGAFVTDLNLARTEFDQAYYVSENKEIDPRALEPLLHYILVGWRSSRNPTPWFSVEYYLRVYPDVAAAGVEPFTHYLRCGRDEGRQPNPYVSDTLRSEFDQEFYCQQSPALLGLAPLEHYVAFGWRQGLNPNAKFESDYYLSLAPDVVAARLNPFFHYITSGRVEGRPPSRKYSREMRADQELPTILIVGHDALHSGAEVVLAEVVRWVANHTRYPVKVILFGIGPLLGRYAEFADVFVLLNPKDNYSDDAALPAFLNEKFCFCYVNTVASGDYAYLHTAYPQLAACPVVVHVHELENVIQEFEHEFRAICMIRPRFIAVSSAVQTGLVKLGIPAEQIYLSNAFIRPSLTGVTEIALARISARDYLHVDHHSFLVIGCGTVYPRKGPDIFIELAAVFFRRAPDAPAQFVWIGGGADLEISRTAIATAGLTDRVRFIGFEPQANRLLAAADVFCLSSREDPFPLVCLESAQYAIPTVFFENAGGIGEFLESDAGIAVPFTDAEAMSEALYTYFTNETVRNLHGITAREKLFRSYTSDQRILQIWLYVREVASLPPAVSVVVLSYNHSKFLKQRMDSVLIQSFKDIEIVALDDRSTDASLSMLTEYLLDPRVTVHANEVNSGSAFKQWGHGIVLARGKLVWIAEGDDFSSENFLSTLVPAFDDPLTNLAFCRTEIVNELGEVQPNALQGYLSSTNFPFDAQELLVDGNAAVEHGFGALCLIVNASSALFRRESLLDIVDDLVSYEICGDWFAYLSSIKRAKLFYSRRATNFFRRHTASVVHALEGTHTYFEERDRIVKVLAGSFALSRRTSRSMLAQIDREWHRFKYKRYNDSKQKGHPLDVLDVSQKRPVLRVGFYVHGLLFSKGGIERVAAQLANELTWRGYEIFIFTRMWGDAAPVYPLLQSVRVISVFDENDLDGSIPALRYELARSDLDVFVPMLSEWLFEPILEASEGLGMKIIASEHNDPWKIEELWWNRKDRVKCFSRVDGVHLLLDRFAASLPVKLRRKVRVIPNGVIPPNVVRVSNEASRRVISIGRLAKQKRFDRLIKAFSALAADAPEWNLVIFGEGGERGSLEQLIVDYGLSQRVRLPGHTSRVFDELASSEIFVLPSEFEGFGIVVIEAQLVGLPCVAYADCNGPNELIADGENGILVSPDQDGQNLALAIAGLIENDEVRQKLGNCGNATARRFVLNNVANEWEEFLQGVMQEPPTRANAVKFTQQI